MLCPYFPINLAIWATVVVVCYLTDIRLAPATSHGELIFPMGLGYGGLKCSFPHASHVSY